MEKYYAALVAVICLFYCWSLLKWRKSKAEYKARLIDLERENKADEEIIQRISEKTILDNEAKEKDLKQASFLKSILESTVDGIIVIDHRGIIVNYNRASEVLFGYPESEMIGKNVKKLMPKEYADSHDLYLKNYLNTGEAKIIGIGREVVCIKKDGSTFDADLSVSEFKIGEDSYFVGMIRNITDQKSIEEELRLALLKAEDAVKSKGMFLANMSHELRTPLNSIIGMAEVIRDTKLTSEQEKYVGTILKSGKNLLVLINDILDISKIEANELNLENIEINLEELVSDVVDVLSVKAYSKDVDLNYYVDSTLNKHIFGDPVRLNQILINLVNNAIKFTEVGEVNIWVKKLKSNEILFEVEDSGVGISKDYLPKLFENFSQENEETTRNYGGTGLGLAICKSLVSLMGGKVGATSELGIGSKFFFTLKMEEGSPIESEKISSEDKYLFVSDSITQRTILKKYLVELKASGSVKSPKEYATLLNSGSLKKDIKLILLVHESKDLDINLFKASIQKGCSPENIYVGMKITDKNTRKVILTKIGVRNIIDIPLLKGNLFEELRRNIKEEKEDSHFKNVAIIDDNEDILELIEELVYHERIKFHKFVNPLEAIEAFSHTVFDLVISDFYMPQINGDGVYRSFVKNIGKENLFIVVTGDVTRIPREIVKEVIVMEKPLNIVKLQQLVFDGLKLISKVESSNDEQLQNDDKKEVSRSVLVVDDSEENRYLMEAYLRKEDYKIDFAVNGEEAYRMMKTNRYAIVFMDIQMPVMDGIECTRKVREELLLDTRIVALTANVQEEEKKMAMDSGCSDYLTKPVSKNDIIKLIEEEVAVV